MSGASQRRVRVGGEDVRVLEKGDGEPVGVLAGLFGLRTWNHFLEALARRRRVVVPSLPGQPGGGDFRALDDLPDWIAATLDVLEAAELAGADLVGFGPGGALAAEVAVFAPGFVRRLALVAPFGLFDPAEPVTDVWAKRLSEVPGTYSARPDAFAGEVLACPAGEDAIEWQVEQVRALESAARLLWPTGDTGLSKRLHRIRCDTLLVWGAQDRVVPPSYAKRWSERLAARCAVHTVPGAGHRVDVDAPDALADAIAEFLDG